MIASQNGHAEVVDTLLQHGASVNLQRKVNSCGFMLSCNSFNLELFALFGNYYNTRTIQVSTASCHMHNYNEHSFSRAVATGQVGPVFTGPLSGAPKI